MLTCIKCMKFTEPQVVVIARSDHHPLCDACGVSMVDLVERIPLEITPEAYELSQEEQDHQIEMQEALDEGEIVEVMEEKPPAAKASKPAKAKKKK